MQRLVAIPLTPTNAHKININKLAQKCINKINNNIIGLQKHKSLIVATFGSKSAQNEHHQQ
jgi:Tfp pilus assembly protein PilN